MLAEALQATINTSGTAYTGPSKAQARGGLRGMVSIDRRPSKRPAKSSPISQSGRICYNILIDENAASHSAWGHAYKFNLENGENMSDEKFAAVGGNLSAVHLNFVIGPEAINVDGVTTDGGAKPVMRQGEWVFEI